MTWLTKTRATVYSVLMVLSAVLSVVVGWYGCGTRAMAAVDRRIDARAGAICDTEISRKFVILEHMIYNQAMLQLKTNIYLETIASPEKLVKARAKWLEDSLKLSYQLLTLGFNPQSNKDWQKRK